LDTKKFLVVEDVVYALDAVLSLVNSSSQMIGAERPAELAAT
jgi:hypothetical protein